MRSPQQDLSASAVHAQFPLNSNTALKPTQVASQVVREYVHSQGHGERLIRDYGMKTAYN